MGLVTKQLYGSHAHLVHNMVNTNIYKNYVGRVLLLIRNDFSGKSTVMHAYNKTEVPLQVLQVSFAPTVPFTLL